MAMYKAIGKIIIPSSRPLRYIIQADEHRTLLIFTRDERYSNLLASELRVHAKYEI